MTFQIQSWTNDDPCTCGIDDIRVIHGWHRPACKYPYTRRRWVPMENGPAKSVWRPRPTAAEAIVKAGTWSGAFCGLGIPAMQVVDLETTGHIVWRSSKRYPAAGDPIEPEWLPQVVEAARRAVDADEAELRAELAQVTTDQGVLW